MSCPLFFGGDYVIKIKTKLKTIFKKSNIKRYLHSALCLLLCVLTVVCFGGVLAPTQAHAVAGVDDAILFFLAAFLICCGMTFTSTSAISNAAQNFYDSSPADVQEVIEYNANKVQVDSALGKGFVAVIKSEWKSLIDEFVRQFPQYSNIELDSTNILKEQLNGNSLIAALVGGSVITLANPWKQDTNVFMQTSASTTLSFYGIDTFKKVYGDSTYKAMCSSSAQLKEDFNTQYAIFSSSIGLDLVIVLGWNYRDNATVSLSYYDYADQFRVSETTLEPFGYGCLLYNKELCSVNYSSSGLTITSPTCGNVVQKLIADEVISSNDNLINCDNLTIRSVKALDQLLLGEDVFVVGVDAAHLPGIDSFPSTTGDITDVSTYPDSIGINVPRDLSDTITKTAEDIRTVDKDKTDTDTKDDTKDDTVSDAKDIADVFDDKIPAIREINDIITGFNNSHAKGFYFEFVFYHKKYVIDCAFYEPYRENVRGALSVLFIVMTFLACFKLFRSCIGISFSGGEGDNDNDQ